jgi:NAD(P)-dependent dehydrogenase (short-subunit alcohol dehydrogenase family)
MDQDRLTHERVYGRPMDRVVVITGTSSGIGLATAVAFAEAGDTVVATMRNPARASDLIAAAADAGVDVQVMALDVTSDASVDASIAQVLDEHGRVDVLVNNAGLGMQATLHELSIDDLQRALDVNYLGVARVTKAVLPSMHAAGGGCVIVVTSIAGALGQPFNDAYCASKHAVEGLFESMRPVEAALGVKVCIVEPGPVATPFHDAADQIDSTDPAIMRLKANYRQMMDGTLDRAQSPDGVAEVIVAVADDPDAPLRHQTSRFTARLLERKLADLSGEQVIAMTSPWIQPSPEPA